MAEPRTPATDPDLPPCLIYIDRDGRLFHRGAEMVHSGLNSLLLAHLVRDGQGRFIIEFHGQRCYVEVEDAPLAVWRASAAGEEIRLLLSDGREEPLDQAKLFVGPANVMYTLVRGGTIPARFTRPAYYQAAEFIEESSGGFALRCGGRLWPVQGPAPLPWDQGGQGQRLPL
jgi:hypothetical protein